LVKRKNWIEDQISELADKAESDLDSALFDLMGDIFYQKK
jgi:hypothetical protein